MYVTMYLDMTVWMKCMDMCAVCVACVNMWTCGCMHINLCSIWGSWE